MNAINNTFSALADPTRRAIIARLAMGEASVGEVAAPFAMSLPAVSRHLRVLEEAALIRRERHGKRLLCSLRPHALAEAHAWLDEYRRFWTDAFDRLDDHLQQQKTRRPR